MAYWSTTITGTIVSHGPVSGGYAIQIDGVTVAYAASMAAGASTTFSSSSAVNFNYDPSNGTVTATGNAQITDYTITANYVPTTFTITCQNDGHGTLSASANSAASGTQITLTPTPNNGYAFDHYTISPSSVSISNNKFTMPASNVTVKAFFKTSGYTNVTAGNKIKATDRSQTGTTTTAGAIIQDSHFTAGTKAQASTFNTKVLGG